MYYYVLLNEKYFEPQLLNSDRPDGSTWDPVAEPVQVCQKTGQCNDPAKPGQPGGSTHDLGEPGQDPVFFF